MDDLVPKTTELAFLYSKAKKIKTLLHGQNYKTIGLVVNFFREEHQKNVLNA